jgi:hypothetical protein
MHSTVNGVVLDRSQNVETGLLETKRQTSSPSEEINCYGPRVGRRIARSTRGHTSEL